MSLANIEQLRSLLDPLTPTFVLIDPLLGDPHPDVPMQEHATLQATQAARQEAWQRDVASIEIDERVSLQAWQTPYVVELQGLHDEWLEESLSRAQAERLRAQQDGLAGEGMAAHRIGGWLQSSMPPEQLAATLAPLLRVHTEATTSARYLRLVDRRVLDHWRHLLGDERAGLPLGRIGAWHYLDASGALSTLRSAAETALAPAALTQQEWRALEQGRDLHITIALWLGELQRREPLPDLPDNAYARTEQALRSADAATHRWPHRFAQPNDRLAWAALKLLHPTLEQHPRLAAKLDQRQADEPDTPLHQLASELHELLSDLPHE